ncbi:MAG: hypothetical protein LQ349_006250 [Xanthoria aureola]|nr:MAG: hypothetical protein LQ349_006250 [Xanthoria aureola]
MAIPDIINFTCRIIQPPVAIIILGYCVYLITELYLPPPAINFLLFTSTWTIFPALPLTMFKYRLLPPYTWSKIGFLLVEVATLTFWFAGFVGLLVWRMGFDVCIGKACGYIIAAIAFAALEWYMHPSSSSPPLFFFGLLLPEISFCVTTIIHALEVWETRHNRSGFTTSEPETTTI